MGLFSSGDEFLAQYESLLPDLVLMSRDNARTPMQWDSSAKTGFTDGDPWIGVNPNAATVNVAAAEADPDSVLNFLRRMIRFRKEHLALVYGSFELLAREETRLLAFVREGEGERLLVEINMRRPMVPVGAMALTWALR